MLYELILFDGATKMPLPFAFKVKFWKKKNAIEVAKTIYTYNLGNVAIINKITRRVVYVCEN